MSHTGPLNTNTGAGDVTSITATAPLTANGLSGVPETGSVTIAITGSGFVDSVSGTTNRITATPTTGNVVVDISAAYIGQTSLTTLGTITTGTWDGSVIVGQYGGTGVANTGLTITLASGAVGKVLASDSSGNATWQALSGIGVTSLQGTANQVLVNATSGTPEAGTLTVAFPATAGISIGSYQTTSAPVGGALFPGEVVVGTNSPTGSVASLQLSNTVSTVTGGAAYGVLINNGISPPANATSLFGIALTPTYTVAISSTISAAYDLYISPILAIGTSGLVNEHYGIYVNSTTTSGLGALAVAYSGFFKNPGIANTNIALHADNLQIGAAYFDLSPPPSNGAIIQGNVSIGSSTATSLFNVGSSNQFQISSSGVVTSGTWNGSVIVGQYGGTGVANTGLTITLASGAVGKVLASDSSGNATWQALSGIGVTSLQGTANQVLVNTTSGTPQTGALTVAFPATAGISIGSYQTTVAPVGGIIAPGQVGIGTSAPTANNRFTVNAASTDLVIVSIQGNASAAGTNLIGIECNPFLSPAATFSAFGETIETTFTSPSGGLGSVFGGYISNTYAGAGTTVVGYGLYIDHGNISGTTLSTAYGIFINCPNVATNNNNYGLNISGVDVDGATTGCKYQAVFNGTITGDDGGVGAGILVNTTFRPTTTGRNAYGLYILPFAVPHSTNTINNAIGIFAQAEGSVASGSILAAYSGYFAQPTIGTGNVALYTDSLSIGYTGTTVSAGNALISGLVSIGTNSHASYIQLEVDTALGYGVALVGTQTGNDGSANQYGFLSDATMNPTTNNTWTRAFASTVVFIAPTSNTIPQAAGFYSYNYLTSNIGTITNCYGVWADTGTTNTGTVTNAYGIYAALPSHGTNKHAAHVDNLSIGSSYTGSTKPPTDGMICQGQVAFGTSSPVTDAAFTLNSSNSNNYYLGTYLNSTISNQDGTGGNWGIYSAITHSLATGCVNVFHHYLQPNISLPSGQTITNVYGLFIDAASQGSGTITNWWGCRIGTGPAGGGGTIGTNIGLQVDVPTNGTTKICAYFAGVVKFGLATTGSKTATFGNNGPMVTTTPNTWIEIITPAGTTGYIPVWV